MRYIMAVLMFWAAVVIGLPATAQETVFLIRHAEKQSGVADPRLTPEGRRRAHGWAVMLGQVGVDVIITSEFMRTRETGGLIAADLGINHGAMPAADITGLVRRLQTQHAHDTVLVVGHSNTVPQIIAGLGVSQAVEIAEDDFANLFVVIPGDGVAPRMIWQKMP